MLYNLDFVAKAYLSAVGLIRKADNIAASVQLSDCLAEFLNGTDKETTTIPKRKFGFEVFSVGNNLDCAELQKVLRAQEQFSGLRLQVISVNYHNDCGWAEFFAA